MEVNFMYKINLMLLGLAFLLLGCDENKKSQNLNILKVQNIESSKFEPNDVKMVNFLILNTNVDTIYLEEFKGLNVSISDKIDTVQNANLIITNLNKNYLKGIHSSMPPEILFSDSAYKIEKYYDKYLIPNSKIIAKKIKNKSYWILAPKSSISIKSYLKFQLNDLYENKENYKSEPISLNLRVKYFKNDTSIIVFDNITYSDTCLWNLLKF